MEYRDKTYTKERIMLDGNIYTGCTFNGCSMAFAGTAPVGLSACTFRECDWEMVGPAELTVQFLSSLYAGGAEELIEATFENIRKGRSPRRPQGRNDG